MDKGIRSSPVRVAVRVRPLNEREISGGQSEAWDVGSGGLHLKRARRERSSCLTGKKLESKDATYLFDHVFDKDSSTATVYETIAQDIVRDAMEGYHSSIFAYGQTSCGKTHTMMHAERGIVALAVKDIFSYIKRCPTREFLLRVSYMEIYNESINDLLVPSSKNLDIFDHPKKGCVISGLVRRLLLRQAGPRNVTHPSSHHSLTPAFGIVLPLSSWRRS